MNEPAQEKFGDFLIFSCVLAHKYFGDLTSGKIYPETNWRPSVSTRGRGTWSYNNLKRGFSGVNEPAQEKLGDFLIFYVC